MLPPKGWGLGESTQEGREEAHIHGKISLRGSPYTWKYKPMHVGRRAHKWEEWKGSPVICGVANQQSNPLLSYLQRVKDPERKSYHPTLQQMR